MKKIAFILGLAVMTFSAGCSGEGAYSEDEKKAQDSTDSERHEDQFEKMEEQMKSGDTANSSAAPGPGMKPGQAQPQPPPASSTEVKVQTGTE